MAAGKCRACGQLLHVGLLRCTNPKCREWNITAEVKSLDDCTVILDDAELEYRKYIPTGLVDDVFGGGAGIAEGSINLLAGEPGAGKTTLCLQLCDIFCGHFPGKEALYIANEQDPSELKGTAKRIGLKHASRIRIVKAMGGITHDIGDILTRYAPCLTILDSVTKWAGEDDRLAVLICERLKDFAAKLNSPMIVINQETKAGEHAGLNKMQHAVDMTCLFDIIDDGTPKTPQTPRSLMSSKNRNGPAPVEQFFTMTGRGLVPCEIDLSDTDAEEDEHSTE